MHEARWGGLCAQGRLVDDEAAALQYAHEVLTRCQRGCGMVTGQHLHCRSLMRGCARSDAEHVPDARRVAPEGAYKLCGCSGTGTACALCMPAFWKAPHARRPVVSRRE
jgi:hypothetical protein